MLKLATKLNKQNSITTWEAFQTYSSRLLVKKILASEKQFDADLACLKTLWQEHEEWIFGEILHCLELCRSIRSFGTFNCRCNTVDDHRGHIRNVFIVCAVLEAHRHCVIGVFEVETSRLGVSFREFIRCTIVKIQTSRCLASRVRVYLKSNVVSHAWNEGDALIM